MKTIIVLAMHGTPPGDFPREELMELFSLHARIELAADRVPEAMKTRFGQLDRRLRDWPRNPQNDPFFTASQELAAELGRQTGCEVVLGFNEFCAPDLDTALDQAAARNPDEIAVITPMMTRGGEHSEKDIPQAIARARERHPGQAIRYVWHLPIEEIAGFLAGQIERSRFQPPPA